MTKTWLYYPEGMKFFGERACKLWNWERFYPIDSKRIQGLDNTVVFWLYDPDDYIIFKDSKVSKRVYWNGSDVYLALNPECAKILNSTPAIHACQSEQQRYILNLIGIDSLIRPFLFGDISKYKPQVQSKTIQDIYINVNSGREEEYGLLHFLRVAKEFREKRFHVFGIKKFIHFDNVLYYDRINEEKYDEICCQFDLYCMLHRNAGTSQSATKATLWGQKIVSINDLSFPWAYITPEWGNVVYYINNPSEHNLIDIDDLNQMDWI